MASPAYFAEAEVNPMPTVIPRAGSGERSTRGGSKLTALSIEFVANVQGAAQADASIAEAIQQMLGAVPGFAGCVVLVADQEKRLVTAITFWGGTEREALSHNSAPWVHRAIAPYLEHCLRVGWFHTSVAGTDLLRLRQATTGAEESAVQREENRKLTTVPRIEM